MRNSLHRLLIYKYNSYSKANKSTYMHTNQKRSSQSYNNCFLLKFYGNYAPMFIYVWFILLLKNIISNWLLISYVINLVKFTYRNSQIILYRDHKEQIFIMSTKREKRKVPFLHYTTHLAFLTFLHVSY